MAAGLVTHTLPSKLTCRRPHPTLQGDAAVVEHAGFFTELYASLKHTMLVPLLEDIASRGTGALEEGQDRATIDWDAVEEGELFGSAAEADEQAGAKTGEQVCFLVPKLLETLLLDARTLDTSRQAAFAKRMLGGAAAAGDTGLTMGLLCLVHRLLR